MALTHLDIVQFKNHERLTLTPHSKWNAFIGLNGSGKTNALDAIYMSSVFKSFLHHSLDQCVRRGADFFRLVTRTSDGMELVIKHPKGGHRTITLEGQTVRKLTDIIGRQPVITIQPTDDYRLLQGSSERRRIIDQAIAQMNRPFMEALLKYTKILRQRNTLLKQMRQSGTVRWDEVRLYDPALRQYQAVLYDGRYRLIDQMTPYLIDYYAAIAHRDETPSIAYLPNADSETYGRQLNDARHTDLASGRTSVGPHLDDIAMHLDDFPLKSAGSQGQRKSFLIAMKLALYQILRTHSGQQPILLLDDLFDKLDMQRVRHLLSLLDSEDFGQVFISEKDGNLLHTLFEELSLPYSSFDLSDDLDRDRVPT